jgi:hypothetical protein
VLVEIFTQFRESNFAVHSVVSKEKQVGFEVPSAVVMKSSILWDITFCSLENQPTFQSNMSLSFSGLKKRSKQETSVKRVASFYIPEDITLCKQYCLLGSLTPFNLKRSRRFGGTESLYLQGR